MFLEQNLHTILDFMRFGLSKANENELYFGHGTDNAWDDICSLILGSLFLPEDTNEALFNSNLTNDEKTKLSSQLYKRIIERKPVPYLIHRAIFCGLPFYVDERVLIPRSPIAELINNKFFPWIDEENVHNILDLCTGSGCIAIACCYAFEEAMVDAIDISEDALEVAKKNVDLHKLHASLNLIKSDCFKALAKDKRYDIIVSNPPYVEFEEKKLLPKEYHHEPDIGLFAADNGMEVVTEILKNAHNYLTAHGILIVEVGNLADKVIETYPEINFTWLEFENGGEGVFLLTKDDLLKKI